MSTKYQLIQSKRILEKGKTSLNEIPLHVDLDSKKTFKAFHKEMQKEIKHIRTCTTYLRSVLDRHSSLKTTLEDFQKTVSVGIVVVDGVEDFESFLNKQITFVIPKYGHICLLFYDR